MIRYNNSRVVGIYHWWCIRSICYEILNKYIISALIKTHTQKARCNDRKCYLHSTPNSSSVFSQIPNKKRFTNNYVITLYTLSEEWKQIKTFATVFGILLRMSSRRVSKFFQLPEINSILIELYEQKKAFLGGCNIRRTKFTHWSGLPIDGIQ